MGRALDSRSTVRALVILIAMTKCISKATCEGLLFGSQFQGRYSGTSVRPLVTWRPHSGSREEDFAQLVSCFLSLTLQPMVWHHL